MKLVLELKEGLHSRMLYEGDGVKLIMTPPDGDVFQPVSLLYLL